MTGIRPGSVKICSLREVEHAPFVLDAGVDLFGLIFVRGRSRYVTPERAQEIVHAVREQSNGAAPLAVGVFVDAPVAEINEITRSVGLDLVQLHGDEPPELLSELDLPAIKAISLQPGDLAETINERIRLYAHACVAPVAFLIDGQQGGAGTVADWSVAAELARDWPVILAGGLTPGNVADSIAAVRPIGVDVSSGVESEGAKDPAKTLQFAAAARAAFATSRFSAAP